MTEISGQRPPEKTVNRRTVLREVGALAAVEGVAILTDATATAGLLNLKKHLSHHSTPKDSAQGAVGAMTGPLPKFLYNGL